MNEFVRLEADLPALRNPLLIAAFGGAWGSSTVAALEHIAEERGTRLLASIEPEPFFDFTVQRPLASIEDGERVVHWPENRFELLEAGPGADLDRDIVLLIGTEPQLRWANFAAAVTAVMEQIGVRASVMLGAFRAPTPHSRPLPLELYTTDGELAAALRLPAEPWSYEGPASISTLLGVACAERGWPTAGLIAETPFYVDAEPQPHATLALVRALTRALDLEVDVDSLEEDVAGARCRGRGGAGAARSRSRRWSRPSSRSTTESPGSFDSIDLAAVPAAPELLADVEAFLQARQRGAGASGEGEGEGDPPSGGGSS